jgi:hypothetical protein
MKINNLQLRTRATQTAQSQADDETRQASAAVDAEVAQMATVISASFDECKSAGTASSYAGSPARQPGSWRSSALGRVGVPL